MQNNQTNENLKWESTCNRFVVYMDVMGFRNLVFRENHNDILKMLEDFSIPINDIEKEAEERKQGKPSIWGIFENAIIEPVIFSDSVLLFSNDNSLGSIEKILWGAITIMRNALKNGIPIKGAIAYGEQTADIDRSLYFGKPLIDALDLEKEIVIYSLALHHSVEKYIIENEWLGELLEAQSIIQYKTPLKQGTVNHYLTTLTTYNDHLKIRKSVSNLYSSASGSVRQYIDNTINFIDYIEKELKPK
jgi:hypothetical protein